jgi:hypothetical protein
MKKATITKRKHPERHQDPPYVPPSSTVAPKTETTPEPESKDRVRMSFFVSADGKSVLWDDMKSDKGRDLVRNLVIGEAEKLGLRKQTELPPEELLKTHDVLNMINMINVQGAMRAGFPKEAIPAILFSEKEMDAVAKSGGDRLLDKYIGNSAFKWKDEIMVSIMLSGMLFAKFSNFKRISAQRSRPRNVQQMMEKCELHGIDFPKGTVCPECYKQQQEAGLGNGEPA